MTGTPAADRDRRYLLGAATDQEVEVIEQEYVANQDAADRLAEAEDDLIEDYLSGQLTPDERMRFDQQYLSSPHRRVRVETVRQLLSRSAAAAARGSVVPFPAKPAGAPVAAVSLRPRSRTWMAVAASVALASAALWLARSRGPSATTDLVERQAPEQRQPATPTDARQPAPIRSAFALTLSPLAVRSAGTAVAVVIPPTADVVSVRLEGGGAGAAFVPTRATIRTVAGTERWQGPVVAQDGRVPGIVAQFEVPADHLPVDDYVVTLHGTDRDGSEREWLQYSLQVRRP